jgi:hypothetical protein
MEIKVLRRYRAPKYTIGTMYVDGRRFSDTLEDRDRDKNRDGDLSDPGEKKVYAETAIPYGRYLVTLRHSPKFGRKLPYINNVPHFEGILIHRGNTPADSAGCILVGENKVVGQVINSTPYEQYLVKLMAEAAGHGEKVWITIV